VPIGIAGPLLIDGEHARGTFYVPLATTEGTLVASYNRGMKLIHQAGGVRTTVMADVMQRAPAFGFTSAREARAFGAWVTDNFAAIKAEAEATTRAGRLHDIEQFSSSRFMFLRFNFTTGDAAGQNLTGKATRHACAWIRAHYAGIEDFCLEANLATDKKSSHVNILRTRGKRVTAEATIPAGLAREVMHTTPGQMFRDPGRRELLLLHHHPGPDRRDLRRRDRPADPARVPGTARLLRGRSGEQAGRDRGGHRPVRPGLAGRGRGS
jgi:hydroxymethylglutaryl-CoA reductase (NADPH)